MTIQELVARFNTVPILFAGSGITRRYYNLPDWKGLLTEFAFRLHSDRFAYRAYENEAQRIGFTQGVMPKIATLIQRDFDAKWYINYWRTWAAGHCPHKRMVSKHCDE